MNIRQRYKNNLDNRIKMLFIYLKSVFTVPFCCTVKVNPYISFNTRYFRLKNFYKSA